MLAPDGWVLIGSEVVWVGLAAFGKSLVTVEMGQEVVIRDDVMEVSLDLR
jgi:hypothetical protein